MNERLLHLLEHPENLEKNDLGLLRAELRKYPYMQSLRSLLLLGYYRFNSEAYQDEMGLTAAYTTDKKVLYRLINQGIPKVLEREIREEPQTSTTDIPADIEEESTTEVPKEEIHKEEVEQQESVVESTAANETAVDTEPEMVEVEEESLETEAAVLAETEEKMEDVTIVETSESLVTREETESEASEAVDANTVAAGAALVDEEVTIESPAETEELPISPVEEKTKIEESVVSAPEIDKPAETTTSEKTEATSPTEDHGSNVPIFVNTWHQWLRKEKPQAREATKLDIIDRFIDASPRISKPGEQKDFKVEEKTDDISHLMTETLANLYVRQKRYEKAVQAFRTLIRKHPDRETEFLSRIEEIRKMMP